MSEQTSSSDGAAVRLPPPFVPVIALAVGIVVHRFVQPFPLPIDGALRWGLGAVLVMLALAGMAAAIGLFRRTGQDPAPWESTPEIIASGIYRYTRNPMYLSMGFLQAGIGVLLANAWLVVLVPVVWWTIYATAIRHEEAYLERKFGSTYTDYRNSVRRWL